VDLLIDPDLLDGTIDAHHAKPGALINRHGATKTVFGFYSVDEMTGPRCPRCTTCSTFTCGS
jgi:hypothetical protein